MSEESLAMLNVYEVETGSGTRHLVCFLDPVLAGARGIDPRSIVGEFSPGEDDEFDPETFILNPAFVDALREYMNDETPQSPELIREAASYSGGLLYIVDPRDESDAGSPPPPSNLVGCYTVDDEGRIVPDSFQYNEEHRFFDPNQGVSGVFADRRFYDWLHPLPDLG